MLDVFTMHQELGTVDSLNVVLIGDLKYVLHTPFMTQLILVLYRHGRTVHSLVQLLSLYNVNITYCSPDSLKMPEVAYCLLPPLCHGDLMLSCMPTSCRSHHTGHVDMPLQEITNRLTERGVTQQHSTELTPEIVAQVN